MKRLISVFFIMAFVMSLAYSQAKYNVKKSDTFLPNLEAEMSTSYKLLSDSLDNQEIILNIGDKEVLQFYSVAIDIDTVSTSDRTAKSYEENAVICLLQKSYDGVTWTTLKTVNFFATADTVFVHQDVTTGTDAPYLKIKNTCNQDSTSVNLIGVDLKLTNKY